MPLALSLLTPILSPFLLPACSPACLHHVLQLLGASGRPAFDHVNFLKQRSFTSQDDREPFVSHTSTRGSPSIWEVEGEGEEEEGRRRGHGRYSSIIGLLPTNPH